VTFGLGHAIPGGPFDREKPLPAEIIANLESYYGLDDPLWKQYTDYLWNAIHGDFGPSYSSRSRSVNDIISAHFPVSAQLGVLAIMVAMVVGIPLGMVSALKQNSFIDYFCMFFALMGDLAASYSASFCFRDRKCCYFSSANQSEYATGD